jgi:hypothetical protein
VPAVVDCAASTLALGTFISAATVSSTARLHKQRTLEYSHTPTQAAVANPLLLLFVIVVLLTSFIALAATNNTPRRLAEQVPEVGNHAAASRR